jgi:hypothetical protein
VLAEYRGLGDKPKGENVVSVAKATGERVASPPRATTTASPSIVKLFALIRPAAAAIAGSLAVQS